MSIPQNPVIDIKVIPTVVWYVDSGVGIFGVTGNPNGVISALAGSFAIECLPSTTPGNWYRCLGGTSWILASAAASPVSAPYRNVVNAGNVGAGATNLHSFTILAGTLANDGDCIRFTSMLVTAANANNKQLQCNVGGTIIFDSGALALNNKGIHFDMMLYRFTSTSIKVKASMCVESTGGVSPFVNYVAALAGTANLNSNNISITWIGTGTANNDISQSATVGEKI